MLWDPRADPRGGLRVDGARRPLHRFRPGDGDAGGRRQDQDPGSRDRLAANHGLPGAAATCKKRRLPAADRATPRPAVDPDRATSQAWKSDQAGGSHLVRSPKHASRRRLHHRILVPTVRSAQRRDVYQPVSGPTLVADRPTAEDRPCPATHTRHSERAVSIGIESGTAVARHAGSRLRSSCVSTADTRTRKATSWWTPVAALLGGARRTRRKWVEIPSANSRRRGYRRVT